jgi:hypothetical protein
MKRVASRTAGLALVVAVLSLPICAGEAPVNRWTPVGDGKFAPPKDGLYPSLVGCNLVWSPELEKAVIVPVLAKLEADIWETSLEKPAWGRLKGTAPAGQVPDRWASPQAYCYMPGLKRVLFLKEQWSYSRNKKQVSGWLVDPGSGKWEPVEADLCMADKSADFNPSKGRDGKRLPIWGSLAFDAHNKEAVSFGGGGTWGRVGKKKEKVRTGDWIFDEKLKRIRRLTGGEGDPAEARRWFPANCGTWTFSEAAKKWSPIPQPMGEQPPGRILPGMAYDSAEKKIVLFGGDDLARCMNDTWIYDCAKRTWKEAKPAVSPTARAGHAMVYVPEAKGVLMCGGYTGGWNGLGDVWVYSVPGNKWTCLGSGKLTGSGRSAKWQPEGMALPGAMPYCSGAHLSEKKAVLMACYPGTSRNKSIRLYLLRLDLGSAPKANPEKTDPKLAYHCKGQGAASTLLPEEWGAGANKPGDPAAGRAEIAKLPANTWVERKFPAGSRARGWGHYAYDIKTHKGIAWGGGHSTYPGAEVSEYDVLTNRWRSMAHATNYNPVWLHGMVGGPPGVSLSGWSLLPTHARKSYTVDHVSGKYITYMGDVYDPKHHTFVTNIGRCPGKYNVSTQVSFVPTPHGLYGYSTGTLARPDVRAGKWEVFAEGGPGHHEHHHLCYDSKRDRIVYFARKEKKVWTFDFKAKQWTEEKPAGGVPPDMTADSTYIPEMDAALLVFGTKGGKEETMYFYKVGERKWYSSPYVGEKTWRVNTGLNNSPRYDPELKTVVRFTNAGHRWIGVFLMRLEPGSLKLTPIQ